ncbi:hypothetical protein, conserved [Babesia bigemina]|uniref:Uncharacterized protein n=1 Tax=Babesia bigemina TaxID=5866 RepID=A0A061DDH5_BABBI|nr:hypothetical protein, conserved [Babesia bigemina]CDR97409.1 hypothetical protein, conserved [Babesia bigemina]|eukprot:XP_012769595.1 hypothetical protein, conserved [Babesia bigemina]
MSQLYIRRSRSIVNDESLTESVFTTPGDWDYSMNLAAHRKHRSEFKIECVFPSAGFLKQLLLPINPSLGGRNTAVFKVNALDYANNQMKSLFYIHLVFDPNCMMMQSMMSGQAMYTCVRVPKSRLLKYSITSMDGSDYRHIVDIAVPLQSLMVCLNMYSHKVSAGAPCYTPPQQEMVMSYDSDDRQIVLNGRCVSYAEYWHTSDIGQSMVCRLKTINLNPLQLPFDGSDFNFVDVDYFSISPKLLYPCLHDIASDSASSKLVLELVPPDETNNRCVLGLARGRSSMALEWDFSYDTNVFDEFNVHTQHMHTYSMRCWQGVTNGIKLARRIRIAIKDDGVLLIQVSMMDHISDGIYFYYQMHPLLDTV